MNPNVDCVGGMDKGKSVPSGFSDDCGVSGMVRVLPRVGTDYQVDIPPYIETRPDGANSWDLSVGLHIPLRWANQEENTTRKLNGSSSIASSSRGRRRSSKIILGGGKSTNASIAGKQPKGGSLDSYLVPEDIIDLWTDIEKTSFILSLYIFEKDFVQVTRFLQTKKTGDIMAYYYGEFYGSNEYYRWSRTLKDRARRKVNGEEIFSGSRLQEILSRLLPIVSPDSHSELLEISRKYVEKRIRFEEYVFTLKSMVGLSSLIEAVGIGKGKQDLTNYSLGFTRSSRAFRLCPEIPIGKACASLTPAEITKNLTEGYRLSNDLKFTVVDTSLCDGKPFKIRDLRSLPLEISRNFSSEGSGSSDIPIHAGSNMSLQRVVERDEVVDNIAPFTKRPRTSPRSRGETSNTSCVSRAEPVMPSSSNVDGPSVSTECVPVQPRSRMLMDLNVLPVSPEPETKEGGDRGKKPESPREVQEATNMSSRRHSTRNRPPTTRALEAFASGFLTVNRRQRSREASSSRQSLGSSSSQQAHVGTRVSRFGNESEARKGGTSSGPST